MTQIHRILFALSILLVPATAVAAPKLSWFEQIPLESYEKMREVERYQLQIAEKHYLKGEHKIALDEYEKFLTLYETSTGAAYSQLMWSHCQVHLRKVNTAIRDGFQSVIDYWPNSEEAILASFLIGKSYQEIGEVEKAKVAYGSLMESYPNGPIPVFAKVNLLDMATVAQDEEERLQLLEDLTYTSKRTDATRDQCAHASRQLSKYYFAKADFPNALKSLSTTYKPGDQLDHHIYEYARSPIHSLINREDTKADGKELAQATISHLESQIPTDLAEDPQKHRARRSLDRIAGVYGALREPDHVIKTYERIGKLLGSSDGLLGQIAGHYRSIGERDKARQTYQKFENLVEGQRHLVYMFREERKFDEAIAGYRGLVDQDPNRISEYLWSVAECYEAKQDWKNAIQSYRQADRFPQNYFRMAGCHRRLKQYKEAITLYSQAKSHESSAPEAMLAIAYTYEEANQKQEAIKTFQQTCRAYPKTGQASRAHAHLQTKYDINVTLGGAKD